MHAPHLMHLDWLMIWGARTAPEMAPVGQPWAQRVQPLHLVGSTMYWMSALHTPAGQRFSRICSRYSSRK